MELEFRRLKGYRYQISKPVTIPVVSKTLREALADTDNVSHPFYQIRGREVWAKEMYAWDGATGAVNTDDLIVPSLIHDIGCQAINDGRVSRDLRKAFDKEYYAQCLLYGVCKERALAHYLIIRGWGIVPKGKEDDIYAKIYSIEIKA